MGFDTELRKKLEKTKQESALQENREFLDSVIENTPNPMWISDSKGRIIRVNKALLALLRLKKNDVVGNYNVLEDLQVTEQGRLPLVKTVFSEGKSVSFILEYNTGNTFI